jgi:deazaflavin-dependent oxidoreductase (nitroreductase family)
MIHDGQGVKALPASGMLGRNFRWLKLKPAGALRLALWLPIYLYRLDLGWLLGHSFLLLGHLGRKSGLLRETVLEVILYDPATREGVVLSAWGEKAGWYRNIEAVPALEVRELELSASRSWVRLDRRTRPRARVCSLRISSLGGCSRCRLTTAQTCNLPRVRSR